MNLSLPCSLCDMVFKANHLRQRHYLKVHQMKVSMEMMKSMEENLGNTPNINQFV